MVKSYEDYINEAYLIIQKEAYSSDNHDIEWAAIKCYLDYLWLLQETTYRFGVLLLKHRYLTDRDISGDAYKNFVAKVDDLYFEHIR